jgi:hypothetical protein
VRHHQPAFALLAEHGKARRNADDGHTFNGLVGIGFIADNQDLAAARCHDIGELRAGLLLGKYVMVLFFFISDAV